jgi:hypothetical protein
LTERDNTGLVESFLLLAGPISASTFTDTTALSGFNLLLRPDLAQSYTYHVTSSNSDLIESAPSNDLLVKDAVGPTPVGSAGKCDKTDYHSAGDAERERASAIDL